MQTDAMKQGAAKPTTVRQKAELEALAGLVDVPIDTRSLPEVRDCRGARRGVLFRPIKQQQTPRP